MAYVESEELRQALASKAGMTVEDAPSLMSKEILRLVASAERSSEHPLAKVRSSLGKHVFPCPGFRPGDHGRKPWSP